MYPALVRTHQPTARHGIRAAPGPERRGKKLRGYVERLEDLAREMPEGQEPTHEDVMESYYAEADAARDTDKNK